MKKSIYDNIVEGLEPEKVITYEAYRELLDKLSRGQHKWPSPRRIEICKTFSQKRRIVYAYPAAEMFILRAVNLYLCKKFRDDLAVSYFPSRQRTPSQCLAYILNKREAYLRGHTSEKGLYGMHLDVSDYFNSMDPAVLFERLPEELRKNNDFRGLYEDTILNPWCECAGEIVSVDRKGAMAGLPFTAFFASVYLSEMDRTFEKAGIPYARYSDDILFFAEDEKSLEDWSYLAKTYITSSGLRINEEKTEIIKPSDCWTFIGFEIDGDKVDISSHQYEKLRRRFSKWARRYRKYVEEGYGRDKRKMPPEKAVSSLIKNINRALFKPVKDQYCWAQWAFPTINTARRLKSLDQFMQEKLRFIYTGRYSRKNFRILPYERLKEMGYHPLEQLYLQYRFRPDAFKSFIENSILSKVSAKTSV